MPRGVQPPNPNRIQTLCEARQAYQKAGRISSLTVAQIRAAERAAEGERRAKEILEKERRAKQNKRKREEQEVRQRSEKRRLVELGKLPEESLWGKVRASQPRLHNFFGAPKRAQKEGEAEDGLDPADTSSDGYERKIENLNAGEDSALLNQLLSSAASVQKIPAGCHECATDVSEETAKEALEELTSQRQETRVGVTPGTQARLDLQLSFSGSQLFSEFVDDVALEAELNGHPVEANEADDRALSAWALESQHDDVALEAELNGSPAEAAQADIRGLPCGTQESQYGLDGVDDADLAGLVDNFENKS